MSNEIRKEALRQYFRYFCIWFSALGLLLVAALVLGVTHEREGDSSRTNLSASLERVYDQAGVLTEDEEERLRRRIAEAEEKLRIDIVLVTFAQSVEGSEAMQQYGYRSTDWEQNMMDYADDFWDENRFGYNRDFEGDGCILVHNWYEGQNGEHLSTSGRVEDSFSLNDINSVFDAVDKYYDTDPFQAYMAYVDQVESLMSLKENGREPFPLEVALVLPLVVALVYAFKNLRQKAAKDTTTASTYVEGGKPVMRACSDDFIRKNVVTRKIDRNNGGSSHRGIGGSVHRSGGGGHHISRSGASHGGGSRRH